MILKNILTLIAFLLSSLARAQAEEAIPKCFVNLNEVNSKILVEMRYLTEWNFLGRKVDGYHANTCYLSREAAEALSKVQKELEEQNLSLIVFDCYRPQRAVSDFAKWARDTKDSKMKSIYYPDEAKELLFERGYIAERSGHSRGSTVDLSIVKISNTVEETKKTKGKVGSKLSEGEPQLRFQESASDCRSPHLEKSGQLLEMGTWFDCFSVLSATSHPQIPFEAQKNRLLLKSLMEKHGFENYSKEWWHYTLKNEPFKDTYFDFPVN